MLYILHNMIHSDEHLCPPFLLNLNLDLYNSINLWQFVRNYYSFRHQIVWDPVIICILGKQFWLRSFLTLKFNLVLLYIIHIFCAYFREIDREEFKKVMALMRSYNRQGTSHRDGLRIGLKVGTPVENGGLLEYFFGKDGNGRLQHDKFVQFLRDLHEEVFSLFSSTWLSGTQHYSFLAELPVSCMWFITFETIATIENNFAT